MNQRTICIGILLAELAVVALTACGCDLHDRGQVGVTVHSLAVGAVETKPVKLRIAPTMKPIETETAVCTTVSKYTDGSTIMAASMRDGRVLIGTVQTIDRVECEVLVPPATPTPATKPAARPPRKEVSLLVEPRPTKPQPTKPTKP